MFKLKVFAAFVLCAILVPMGGIVVVGQGKATTEFTNAKPIELLPDAEKVQAKDPKLDKPVEAPKEVKIPEARTDKVQLFQEQAERLRLEQQLAIEEFKASEKWKALEARQKQISDKFVAELSSALRLAGVPDADFDKYTYDKETLTFKRKEAPKK